MGLTWQVSVDRMGPAFLSWAFVEEEVGDGQVHNKTPDLIFVQAELSTMDW